MATIEITNDDRINAETFLQQYLTEALPEGDFSRGSFLYETTVSAMAYTVAFLRKELALVESKQSLRGIMSMAEGAERDSAADAILSNWFLTRKTGVKSTGVVRVYLSNMLSSADAIDIYAGTRFYYDATTIFEVASDQTILPHLLIPIYSGGVQIGQYFLLSLQSVDVGTKYDVTPNVWLKWDPFYAGVTKVENVESFAGGASVESTSSFIARAADSVSTRDLSTARSIRATLRDTFAAVNDVVVVGAGDPEMQRDSQVTSGGSRIHLGGAADAYIHGQVAETTWTAVVGDTFTDPRPNVLNFTSPSLAGVYTLLAEGDSLKIHNAASGEPDRYLIESVTATTITVNARTPFPEIKDGVEWSVGRLSPLFTDISDQIDLDGILQDGVFTKAIQLDDCVLLPPGPVYRIRSVKVYVDNTSVTLTRNGGDSLPSDSTLMDLADLNVGASQYVVFSPTSKESNSALSLNFLKVPAIYNGRSIEITYDTLVGFTEVNAYVQSSANRTVCANVLPRGMHPAYVRCVTGSIDGLVYTLRPGFTSVDEVALRNSIVSYINTFPPDDVLHTSDLVTFIHVTFPAISGIDVFEFRYSLFAPDGRVIEYTTNATLNSSVAVTGVKVDPLREVVTPPRLATPLSLGIADRTTRYLTAFDLIQVVKGG